MISPRLVVLTIAMIFAFSTVLSQESNVNAELFQDIDSKLTRHNSASPDSNSGVSYNKTFHFSIGIGSEFSYLNPGIRLYEGLYATVSIGKMLIPDNDAWFGSHSAKFYKIGILWRLSSDENTYVFSTEIGEARLYVQDSFDFLYIPNLAKIGSLLAGYEWRYDSGFTLALRGGINYSRRQTKADFFRPGVLFNAGWSF